MRTISNICRRVTLAALVPVAVLAGVMTARHGATRTAQDRFQKKERDGERAKFLFVWAGDQARTNPDFLTVVNFDAKSSTLCRFQVRAQPATSRTT